MHNVRSNYSSCTEQRKYICSGGAQEKGKTGSNPAFGQIFLDAENKMLTKKD
jgi:hypothetical protein